MGRASDARAMGVGLKTTCVAIMGTYRRKVYNEY